MALPLKPLIVFDLDGTLAATAAYWLPVLREMDLRVQQERGLSHALPSLDDALSLLGKPDTEIFAVMYPGLNAAEVEALIAYCNEVWKELLPQHPFQLFEGVPQVLAELQAMGFDLFLSSNCDIDYLTKLPDQTGIGHYFLDRVCLGHYPKMEKWEFTREMLSRRAPAPGYFVGDSSHDMIAGRENGLVTVHAAYGYARQPAPELIDHQIDDIRELPALLRPLL